MSISLPTSTASFDQAMFKAKQGGTLKDLQKMSALRKNEPDNLEEIKTTAKDFEAVFISQMMSHMFKGIKADSMFGGGNGEDMFSSMLVTEYGKEMAKGSGIGIADQLQKAIIQMQEYN